MEGSVTRVLRNATFEVELDSGLPVLAKAAGKMRRGRKIRILAGDRVAIASGLQEGERVVVSGGSLLSDGTRVQIVESRGEEMGNV